MRPEVPTPRFGPQCFGHRSAEWCVGLEVFREMVVNKKCVGTLWAVR